MAKQFVELKLQSLARLSLTASSNEHSLVTNSRDFLAGHDLSIPANVLAFNELQFGA